MNKESNPYAQGLLILIGSFFVMAFITVIVETLGVWAKPDTPGELAILITTAVCLVWGIPFLIKRSGW